MPDQAIKDKTAIVGIGWTAFSAKSGTTVANLAAEASQRAIADAGLLKDDIDGIGTGRIESFAVPHRAFNPAFAGDVPYVIAHIVLDGSDGRVVLVSNVEGCAWPEVQVGLTVEVLFADGNVLPKFRPR